MHYKIKLTVVLKKSTAFSAFGDDVTTALREGYPDTWTRLVGHPRTNAEGVMSTAREPMELAMSLCETCQTAAKDNFVRFELIAAAEDEEFCFASDGQLVEPVNRKELKHAS